MRPLILVVENEPSVLHITRRHLEEAGLESVTAESAAHAMKVLDSGRIPDLLILDIRLPGVSGPALALQIHRQHPAIPVLFISGWVHSLRNPDQLAGLQWEFLPKPYEGDALVGAVRRLLVLRGVTFVGGQGSEP